MKVAYGEKHIVASQGIVSQSGFRIQASAHAYKILSDGLYSDKPMAVLREIGCNANDAHIAIGRPDLPIEVKLPNSLAPDMYIKDFGPGLSDEEVRGLYTTYFSSTKQDSNDFTGAFGLGSKSPFSYTDSFTVVSVKDGVERTYTASIDDEGVPLMALMNEKPASPEWPHGVLVGMAVRPSDFAEFSRKAKEIFQWFTVKPNVLGMSVDQLTPVFAMDTPNFALTGNTNVGDACVIMGNVRYPLSADKLGYTGEDAIDSVAIKLLCCGIHLRLPIGTVQVAASREQLQYDKGSKPALIAALRAAALEFSTKLNEVAQRKAKNQWDLRISCQRFIRDFNVELRTAAVQAISLTQPDESLATLAKGLFSATTFELPNEAGGFYQGKAFTVFGYIQNEKTSSASRKSLYNGKFYRGNEAKPFVGEYLRGFKIYVNDDKSANKRMRILVGTTSVTTSIMVSAGEGTTLEETMAYAKMLSDKMGGAPVLTVSALPALEKRARAPKGAAGPRVRAVASAALVNVIRVEDNVSSRKGATRYQKPLNTVPDSEKYFLVKSEGSGGNSTYLATPGFQVGPGCESMGNSKLDAFLQAVRHVNRFRADVDMSTIDGFLLVSESAVKRLKLEALGFQPLVVAVNKATMEPAVAECLRSGTRGLPFMGNQEHAHPVESMIYVIRQNKKHAELVRRVMKGKPMEKLIVQDLPKVKGTESQELRNKVSVLNTRFERLSLPVVGISEIEMTSEEVKEEFVSNFPLTALFGTSKFISALQNDKIGEVFLQQVLITPKDIDLIHALKNQQENDSVLLKAAA